MANVSIDDVSLERHGVEILSGVSLEISDGEFVAVIGPSGAGKSSLLRLITGLIEPTGGDLRIDGRPVNTREPWQNRAAMVFQDDALYDHMTVGGNLEFPWRVQGHDSDDAKQHAEDAATRVGVRRLWNRMPRTLSGGQRGQVATARALSRETPSIVLLDEPLSQADAALRKRFRAEILRLHGETGLTMVLATNDQHEAMAVADTMVIMMDGRIRQVGPPEEVYLRPANADVARFVGDPPMNLIPARHVSLHDTGVRDAGVSDAGIQDAGIQDAGIQDAGISDVGILEVGEDRIEVSSGPGRPRRVLVGVYPNDLTIAPPGTPVSTSAARIRGPGRIPRVVGRRIFRARSQCRNRLLCAVSEWFHRLRWRSTRVDVG